MTRFLEILVVIALLGGLEQSFGPTAVAVGIIVFVLVLAPLDRAVRDRRNRA